MVDSGVCYTENGKRVKGIYASNTGPLTVTSAHVEHQRAVMQQIRNALLNEFKVDDHGNFIISSNSRSVTSLTLLVQSFPAYTYSAGLDRSYMNQYIVPQFITTKVDNSVCV